jgi:hypothetical protein
MPVWVWVVIVVVVLAVVALAILGARRKRRTGSLRGAFGPEYERTVADAGNRKRAESELEARQERRAAMDLRQLDPAARERFRRAWSEAQAQFVDSPAQATREADLLVAEVMRDRGYPMENFEQRAADISVDHPEVVENYRAAHGVSLANDQGKASTEDLRRAMVHYRSLFQELLEAEDTATEGDR